MIAYLVVRQGNQWGTVYRLIPGQILSIGRAPTNRVVLNDEICSRHHCEIFQTADEWVLRDLGSRNGTILEGKLISGDAPLVNGQVIQVGNTELAFTLNLDDLPSLPVIDHEFDVDSGTVLVKRGDADDGVAEIVHRQRTTQFDRVGDEARDRMQQALGRLYQLALQMGSARDTRHLAEMVLDALLAATPADIGAILVVPTDGAAGVGGADLTVLAYRAKREQPYQRVSNTLSNLVLQQREAILARDVATDRRLEPVNSLGEIRARSLICAPIRIGQVMHGLIHLYSTDAVGGQLERDHLEFTLAVADQLGHALEGFRRQESLADGLARAREENQTLREQLSIDSELVGNSPFIQQLNNKIGRIAPTDATVLIRGESGVGKELVARAIHYSSRRRNGPFICLNCAALTESLLESELFGHEKGAFTGATARKIGKFEQAHRGTLFLDEVGEMSPSIQSKFLRVLEGHPYERIGGGQSIKVDVRVVSATNRNLEAAIDEGKFRKDLYFRLHVVEIVVAPLRDHPSDIPVLAEFFLERLGRKTGRPVRGFTPEAMELLRRYDWPGNVRELQNTIERAVILTTGDLIGKEDIQLSALGRGQLSAAAPPPASGYREMRLEELEQEHILATLEWTRGNKSQAAQLLGIERSTLDRKLKRYNVLRGENG